MDTLLVVLFAPEFRNFATFFPEEAEKLLLGGELSEHP